MMRKLRAAVLLAALAVFCTPVFVIAQEKPATPAPNAEKKAEAAPEDKKESAQAEAKDEEAQFKESASVRFMAKKLGVSVTTAYWISTLLNFGVIAGAIIWAMKKGLPTVFRDRTSAIQKGIEEARKASAKSAA